MNKILALVFSFAASFTLAAEKLPTVIESWGGDGISLKVYSNKSVSIRLSCASAWVAEGDWVLKKGQLSTLGVYKRETGRRPIMPIRPEQAAFDVKVKADTMNLVITISHDHDMAYKLVKGAKPKLKICM